MPKKAKSKAQAGLFGAAAGGSKSAQNKLGMGSRKAKEMLRGSNVKKLPRKKG